MIASSPHRENYFPVRSEHSKNFLILLCVPVTKQSGRVADFNSVSVSGVYFLPFNEAVGELDHEEESTVLGHLFDDRDC